MNINFNNLIEKFILGGLNGKELKDFHQEIENSTEFSKEVRFQTELAEAITEKDIVGLRDNLKNIISESALPQVEDSKNAIFDLSKNINKSEISSVDVQDEDFENSIQFIHLNNHKKAQTERVHEVELDNSSNMTGISDEQLWKEISTSLQEHDIIDLRDNLKNVISNSDSEISDYKIDQYIDAELSSDEVLDFEKSLGADKHLASMLNLHTEINEALQEQDIIDLRASIGSVIDKEQEIDISSFNKMDEYLSGYLDDKELSVFDEKLTEEYRFRQEHELNIEINNAIREDDVMDLRTSLSKIAQENEASDDKIRQLIPIRKKSAKLLGAAASVAAVVTVGAMTFSQSKMSSAELYDKAYQPYEATGLFRSSVDISPEIAGIDLYNRQKYNGALEQFKKVLIDNPEHPMCNFYSGLSYQEIGKYTKAIEAYRKVIDEKDNLFIEQAEWYMALCYLQTNEQTIAYKTFNDIIDKNGYYSKNVKDIMKNLK